MAKVEFGGMLSSGRSGFNGLISGIDTDSLIEAAIEKKKVPVTKDQASVDFNAEKIAAFSTLSTKIEGFKDTLTSLKGLRFSEDGTDALTAKVAKLSSSSTDTPSKYLSITANSEANLGTFNVEVVQIAKNKILQSSVFTDPSISATNPSGDHTSTSLFTPGSFQINGITITIPENATLNQVEDIINAKTGDTNVIAQIINPSTGDYRLVLQSTETGTAHDITLTDVDNTLNSLFTGAGKVMQSAQDAKFKYNGSVTVTRSSNNISDFIDGVTFNLYGPTETPSSFTIDVSIERDKEAAVSAIKEFVSSYNDLMKFVTQQQGRDEFGNYYDSAKIQHNDYLSNLANSISDFAGRLAYVTDSAYGTGIHFVKETAPNPATNEPAYKNLLSLDEEELRSALDQDFNRVKKLFDFEISTNSKNIQTYTRGNGFDSMSFSMDIDVLRASNNIVRVTYGATTINMDFTPNNPLDLTKGGSIKGQKGTIFEGYEFVYGGTGTETISMNISQGNADKIYNLLDITTKIDLTTGSSLFQKEVSALVTENVEMLSRIKRKTDEIATYKEQLIEKYSRMEAALAKANTMLTLMDVQMKVMSNK